MALAPISRLPVPAAITTTSLAPSTNRRVPSYEQRDLSALFDKLSRDSYGSMASVLSLGMIDRWRRQAVEMLAIRPGETVLDLMSGGGEAFPNLLAALRGRGEIIAVDLSHGMCRSAQVRKQALLPFAGETRIHVSRGDATQLGLARGSVDAIFCGFGVKTLSEETGDGVAKEVARVLKPGGRATFVEATRPKNYWLRGFQKLHLDLVVPLFARLIAGENESFTMVNRYLTRADNCESIAASLRKQGLEVEMVSLMFGSGTVIVAKKPVATLPLTV